MSLGLEINTAEKLSVFGVFLVVFSRIPPEYGKIWNRKNPNTDTFHVVYTKEKNLLKQKQKKNSKYRIVCLYLKRHFKHFCGHDEIYDTCFRKSQWTHDLNWTFIRLLMYSQCMLCVPWRGSGWSRYSSLFNCSVVCCWNNFFYHN